MLYDPKFTVKEFLLHPKSLGCPRFFAAAISKISMLEAGVEMLGAQVPAGTQHFSWELNIAS